jgi:predicted RNase H-like nuclease/L-amino acid N-acyltransferase YncA
MPIRVTISGFDSAWSCKNRGAIAHILVEDGIARFAVPETASFEDALAAINRAGSTADVHVIGVDQPLIVLNQTGCRPVERVFQPLMSSVRGAIQPSNRGKTDLFGELAPIWDFLDRLNADIDWTRSIGATSGRHAIEVYPAAALLGLFPGLLDRKRAAKYNPANKKMFSLGDWQMVCNGVADLAVELEIADLADWATAHAQLMEPRKADQDCLDAALCALIAYLWWTDGYRRSLVVGDLVTGYIVTPTNPALTHRLASSAELTSVPIHPVGGIADGGLHVPELSGSISHVMIRDACVAADAEAIATIYNQGIEDRVATLETQLRTADERAAWMGAKGPRHPVLVAVDDAGTVMGWGSLNQFNPRAAYDHVAEFSVYVGRELRGRGVGTALLSALEDRARAIGFHKMVLGAFPWNEAGMRLYERHGFRTVGTYREQGRLDGRWVDVVVMEKILD